MEIVKEKFIETFKKECDKASTLIKPESFRTTSISNSEFSFEIVSNEKVSFYISKESDHNVSPVFYCSGKILFGGFVDYKSIELTLEEFESIYDYYYECELKTRMAAKNKIIAEGETILAQILG